MTNTTNKYFYRVYGSDGTGEVIIDEFYSTTIITDDNYIEFCKEDSNEELKQQYEDLMKLIDYYKQILADDVLCMKVVKDELIEIKEKYGDERRTEIDYRGEQFNAEDFIPNDDVIITIQHMEERYQP